MTTNSTSNPDPQGKLYDARAIIIATILGTLAAGVYMLYANYRTLGYPKLAMRIAIVGWIAFAGLIFITSWFPQNSPWLTLGFAALQVAIAYGAYQLLQSQALAYHKQQGRALHGVGSAVWVGLLAAIILLVVFAANVMLLNSLGVTGAG